MKNLHHYINESICINDLYITTIVFVLKKKGHKTYHIYHFDFPRPSTDTLILRNIVNSITGRKQLKHKSKLYDFP